MRTKDRLDRRTVQEIERSLRDRHARLRESMRSAIAQRNGNGAGRSTELMARATETLHEEIQVAIVDLHSRQAAQIEAALERLGQQEYGFCRDCAGFIGVARLRALPFAQRCQPCQARAESRAQEVTPDAALIATDDAEWGPSATGGPKRMTQKGGR
ncbi:MAG: TraR/DksA C4-type zinc finger protein [Candidatus Rokubacteria bacterium]|nr:TraR/DksA C4-type zinc finger protein [Candidatus Rokubacteria bacterium]MBI2879032.1 TraR/DksA C4-type zinc finger protein [Candidatus Rokubacteria bacterium]